MDVGKEVNKRVSHWSVGVKRVGHVPHEPLPRKTLMMEAGHRPLPVQPHWTLLLFPKTSPSTGTCLSPTGYLYPNSHGWAGTCLINSTSSRTGHWRSYVLCHNESFMRRLIGRGGRVWLNGGWSKGNVYCGDYIRERKVLFPLFTPLYV